MADAGIGAIGAKIRKRRQALRMTQQDLADKVGADRASVASWESGKHYPLRKLGAIEDALGISLTSDPEPVISPRLRRMVDALSPDERDWLLAELRKVSGPRREDPGDGQEEPDD